MVAQQTHKSLTPSYQPHAATRTTYDDLYNKRAKMATVDDRFFDGVRNA